MSNITSDHFGGNIILTRDDLSANSPFSTINSEIDFHAFRYPGGAVTENQTWSNGGLERMFGALLDPKDPDYVMTIREALEYSAKTDVKLTIVVPTKQFYDHVGHTILKAELGKYFRELEKAIADCPGAKIKGFEIGNEYWGDGGNGALSPVEYGKIANEIIPQLDGMGNAIAAGSDTPKPGIGIQAGAQWRAVQDENGKWKPTGISESHEIASAIGIHERGMITTIYQHSYPDAQKQVAWQVNWAVDPMKAFADLPGFSEDLELSLSEFNVGSGSATGVAQGASWIEAFSARIDAGINEFYHWGIGYEWLSNKFFDTRFPAAESDDGNINAIATPMGQVYDIAETLLIGKSTISDYQAVKGFATHGTLQVTGFKDAGQKVVFLYNQGLEDARVDLSALKSDQHVTIYHLADADSPHTPLYDESIPEPPKPGAIVDARGDMHVEAGTSVRDLGLGPGELGVVVISDPSRDLVIEGAHNVTDVSTGMVDDLISGGSGNDIIRGHVGNDTLAGGQGRDVISGGRGDDVISGGKGDDVIFSGQGSDVVRGGGGDDLVVISGGREGDLTSIATGEGSDLVLIGTSDHAVISDFSDNDLVGFDGGFSDADSLRDAMAVDGDDLVISLRDGGELRLAGAASRMDDFHKNVFDFRSQEEILQYNEKLFKDLTIAQINEFYDRIGSMDGDPSGAETAPALAEISSENFQHESSSIYYWEGREETMARFSSDPELPDEYNPDTEPNHPDDSLEEPETSEEDPNEDAHDYRDEPSDTGGGSCFVATAAFGDSMHPDVVALRSFRDLHLVRYRAGRAFVRIYWIIGPLLAGVTKPHHIHAMIARRILSALVMELRKRSLV